MFDKSIDILTVWLLYYLIPLLIDTLIDLNIDHITTESLKKFSDLRADCFTIFFGCC